MKLKNLTLFTLMSVSVLNAGNCTEWYSDIRIKYNIVGTKAGIVMDQNGAWKKLFAKGTASVDFDDADEREDALEEAEMKAKAVLTHFMKEDLSSVKFVENISKKAKELQKNGNNESKSITKKSIKLKSVKISNNAHSILKGVLTFCESINPGTNLVTVIVGVSPKTQRAADSSRRSMHTDSSSPRKNSNSMSGDNSIKDRYKGYMDASSSLDF